MKIVKVLKKVTHSSHGIIAPGERPLPDDYANYLVSLGYAENVKAKKKAVKK